MLDANSSNPLSLSTLSPLGSLSYVTPNKLLEHLRTSPYAPTLLVPFSQADFLLTRAWQ